MLAVIGDIVQDIVVWQREKVRPATDTASDIFIQRGGSAANVAAFAGPRTPTRFIGCVGDDLAGLVLTRELESHGVEVKNQVRGADGATGTIVLQIDLDGERSMFPSRGASAMLTTIDPAWVAGVDLLHLTAYSFETPGPHDQIRNPGNRFPQGDEQPEHSAGNHNDRDDREPPGQSGIQPHPDPMGEGRPALSPRRTGATASLGLVEHHPQQCIAVAFPPRLRIPPQQLPVPWFVGHVTPRSAAAPSVPTQALDWRAPSVRTAPARWFPHPGGSSRPR